MHDVETGVYNFALDDSLVLSDENFDAGGVYVVLVNKNDTYVSESLTSLKIALSLKFFSKRPKNSQ